MARAGGPLSPSPTVAAEWHTHRDSDTHVLYTYSHTHKQHACRRRRLLSGSLCLSAPTPSPSPPTAAVSAERLATRCRHLLFALKKSATKRAGGGGNRREVRGLSTLPGAFLGSWSQALLTFHPYSYDKIVDMIAACHIQTSKGCGSGSTPYQHLDLCHRLW